MKATSYLSLILAILITLPLVTEVKGEELPFGIIYSSIPNPDVVTSASIDSLETILGFNTAFLCRAPDGFSRQRLTFFKAAGMNVISYMMNSEDAPSQEAFEAYLNAHYLKIEAEDIVSATRFLTRNGQADSNGWFCHGAAVSPFVLLDDFSFKHECTYFRGTVTYQPFIRMWAERGTIFDTSRVAIVNIWRSSGSDMHSTLFYSDTARGMDFNTANPAELDMEDFFYNGNCENWYYTYQIVSTGACSLAVDWFKEYNDDGRNVIENARWDTTYARYCAQGWVQDTIAVWQLRDDIKYDMLIPTKRVDSIIVANNGKKAMSKYYPGYIPSPAEYIHLAKPRVIAIDPYPFKGTSYDGTGGCNGGYRTLYAGNYYNPEDPSKIGLQNALDYFVVNKLATLRAVLQDSSLADSTELCYYAQMQSRKYYECSEEEFIERPATGSEMRCEASIAFCYGIKGLFYWPYGYHYGTQNGQITTIGLIEKPGGQEVPTMAWAKLSEYVTPWVKAIDSVYMGLDWQRAYACSSGTPINPPLGAFVSSISAVSNPCEGAGDATECNNPDLGWFQVGEFTDSIGTPYIMLVNRACSQGMWDPTEAPSVTATVRFNPSNLNLGDYVYVIDLADSIYRAGGDTGWVGIPQTTYTAKMADGTIPFTTTLRAGEGRLFKMVAKNPPERRRTSSKRRI